MFTQKRSLLAAVIVLALAGFALRVYRINQVALRGDEAFTVIHWMREPLAHTLADIATRDPHPPLAYALYRAWDLIVGPDERLARFLPALFGIIGIPAIFALGKRLGGARVGLLAALLWAIHPYAIWHAQDVRNYAIWSSLSLVAVWLAVRALERDRRLDRALYVAAALLAAYVYYLELFTLVALTLFALFVLWGRWKRLAHWIAAQAVIGLVLAPWFLQPRLLVGSGYGGTTGGFSVERLWLEFLPTLTFGQKTLPDSFTRWLWLLLAPVFAAAVVALWHQRRRLVTFTLLLALVPLALLALVSLKLNVFEPRYVLASAPAYVVLFAAFVVWLWARVDRRRLYRSVSVVLLGAWAVTCAVSLSNYYFVPDYAKAPDWRGMVSYLKIYSTSDDLIVQAAADEALNFYYAEYGITADRKQLPANPGQSVAEIDGLLQADLPTHASMWRVAQTFPDWPNAGVVERWLDANMQPVRNTSIDGLRVQQYMPWQPRPAELAPAPLASFAGATQLVGARALDPGETPGTLTVWLYWKPTGQTPAPLKVFVQLIGATNPTTGTPLWTQDDHFPQDGRIASTSWGVGQVYRDVYVLPLANVPAGNYTLMAGLYDPSTGARLPVDGSDHYQIETLRLGP